MQVYFTNYNLCNVYMRIRLTLEPKTDEKTNYCIKIYLLRFVIVDLLNARLWHFLNLNNLIAFMHYRSI